MVRIRGLMWTQHFRIRASLVCGVNDPRQLTRSACVVRFRPEQTCAVTDSVSEQQWSVRSISIKKPLIGATSVVTVAGICNSVGGGVFLTFHRVADAGGKYRSMSRLGLLTENRWMSRLEDQIVPVVLECANCSRSRHAMVGSSLSETSRRSHLVQCLDCPCCPGMRVGKRTCAWERAGGVADWTDSLCVHSGSNDAAFR